MYMNVHENTSHLNTCSHWTKKYGVPQDVVYSALGTSSNPAIYAMLLNIYPF